jgi:hypothetical protein
VVEGEAVVDMPLTSTAGVGTSQRPIIKLLQFEPGLASTWLHGESETDKDRRTNKNGWDFCSVS